MSASAAASTRAALGGAFILLAESAVIAGWTPISTWTTPICWWGYIFVLDALVQSRSGRTLLGARPGRFASWTLLSIGFWLVFEAYNLRLRNWEYVGLPGNRAVRTIGYAVSFASILPGMFLTSAALASFGAFERSACRPWRVTRRGLRASVAAGAACLTLPLLVPEEAGRYLFAPVWVGFVLLLEPLNRRLGAPSVLRDLERGAPGRALRLLLSGYLCGLLWEFWNYWADAKWIYHVPYLPSVRIFEMPILGFLGFGPFALEFHSMYAAAVALWRRAAGAQMDERNRVAINL
jgi:hypothetical protein